MLFRDQSASLEAHRFIGLFSQIGILIWSLGAGSLLLACLVAARAKAFLKYSLVLTILLLLDDAFLIHELAGERVGGLGETAVYVLYGLLVLLYLIRFYRVILQSHFLLLVLALGAFGGSVTVDSIPELGTLVDRDLLFLIEDGCKMMGIVFWTTYQIENSLRAVE